MKKFIALAIAIVMLAALAVPAFAALSETATTGTTTVTYSVGESYTISIPTSIAVGGTGTITADAINLLDGHKVTVTADTDGKFGELEDCFTVTVDGEGLTAEFDAAAETATVAVVAGAGIPEAAGTYTGSITFTSAIN